MTDVDTARLRVNIESGAIEGEVEGDVARFLGVPFAAPPFGANRMTPPQPVEPWDGVKQTVQYGPTAPKAEYSEQYAPLFDEPVIEGDECLNLNIWTPAHRDGIGRPVMVWIHGGAFAHGSGSAETYDGSAFARDGIVCVTINYRLGAEGFLDFGDGTANLGLLDQIAALEWVQRNIAAFGGDPTRVTVAGESAGAMSVTALMAMPRSDGLFAQAIAQSGAALQVLPSKEGSIVRERLAEILGIPGTRAAFAGVEPDVLALAVHELVVEAQTDPDPERWGHISLTLTPFAPVVDGAVLERHPMDAVRAGVGAAVPLLTGWNLEEGRLFMVRDGAVQGIDEGILRQSALGLGLTNAGVDRYSTNRPQASSGDVLAQIFGDRVFAVPILRLAEARELGAPTWIYRFDYDADRTNSGFGAAHYGEVAYVFDTIHQQSAQAIIGRLPSRAVVAVMHETWVRFIRDGDPGWQPYDVGARTIGLLSEEVSPIQDPLGDERALWTGIS